MVFKFRAFQRPPRIPHSHKLKYAPTTVNGDQLLSVVNFHWSFAQNVGKFFPPRNKESGCFCWLFH